MIGLYLWFIVISSLIGLFCAISQSFEDNEDNDKRDMYDFQ